MILQSLLKYYTGIGGLLPIGFIYLVLTLPAPAAAKEMQTGQSPAPLHADTGRPAEQLIIDSVEIHPEDVFDVSKPKYDNFLFRLANSMHIVTRPSVIRRELLLGKGDRYDTALVNESLRNLRSLPYLFEIDIRMKTGDRGEQIMVVETSDKWTTTGGLSFHRTGGRNDLQIGVEENNFLGYGISMSHDYFILEDDRNFYQTEFGDDRVWGQDFSFYLFYSDNPRAGQVSATVGVPYYSLRQKWGGKFAYSELKRRLDYYVAQFLIARERTRRDKIELAVSYRDGPPDLKHHFTIEYSYLDLVARSRKIYVPSEASLLPPPAEDSLVNYFEFTYRLQQINYTVFERLNRFHKPEDINLGLDARVSFGAGYDPGFDHRLYQYISWWPYYSLRLGSSLLLISVRGEHWRAGGEFYRQRVEWYAAGYSRYHRNNTFAFRFSLLSNRLKEKSFTLYLDEDQGLRGFPAFSFNGENRLVANVENRFFSDIEILSVGIGGVIFADIGNIWTRESEPKVRDTKWSCGVGFRFGVSRSSEAEVVRIDFAYAPQRGSWEISVGTGQYF